MYGALLNNRLVYAVEEAEKICLQKNSKHANYYCPRCGQQVVLVMAQVKIAFFKHIKKIRQEGEGYEHQTSKKLIKSALTAAGFQAELEVPLAEGNLRADILVADKFAVEVQCAPISDQEFEHRHQLYRQIGLLDLWMVGSRHWLTHKFKHTQLKFLRRNQRWGTYLLEIHLDVRQIHLKYNLKLYPVSQRARFYLQKFPLDELGVAKLWEFAPAITAYQESEQLILQERKYLKNQVMHKTKLGIAVAQKLYQLHMTIDQLPSSAFKYRNPGQASSVLNFLAQKNAN